MPTLNITLPMPHAGQRKVMQEMRRWNWLSAGRRWRKSTLAMAIAVEKALAGKHIVWGAPTYDQVRIGWGELKRATAGVFKFNHTHMIAESPTGGKITFRSLDNPDNARGHTADFIIIDECADVVEEAWYEVLRPMLIDTHGGLLALGTPKGRNWFWRESMLALDRADSMAWQVPTVGAEVHDGRLYRVPHPMENPDIPFSELEQMFASTPERTFRQEILAEFLENAGGVFQNVRGCVGGKLLDAPEYPTRQYVAGVDLAKFNDYSVICIMDKLTKQVVAFERFNLAEWPVQKARIQRVIAYWNNALTFMDSTGLGSPIYDDLRQAGMRIHPYQFTQESKRQLIDNAVLMVEQQECSFPAELTTLISELSSYEYERLPGGGLRMNAPQGMHDDCVIAFALACWPLQHTSAGLPRQALDALATHYTDLNAGKLMGRTF